MDLVVGMVRVQHNGLMQSDVTIGNLGGQAAQWYQQY